MWVIQTLRARGWVFVSQHIWEREAKSICRDLCRSGRRYRVVWMEV